MVTNRATADLQIGLSPAEVDLCIQALGQMPYFQAAPLITKIVRIVQEAARADTAVARVGAGAGSPPAPGET